jgi:hypothetical protein
VQPDHVVRQPLDSLDAARQPLDSHVTRGAELERLETQIAPRMRLAEQDEPVGQLDVRKAQRPAVRVVHLAVDQARATGAAVAAVAPMRHIEARLESGIEHRLIRGDLEISS